jgi:multidrug efflux pump subunit AcrB
MTVVPLYCAYFIRLDHSEGHGGEEPINDQAEDHAKEHAGEEHVTRTKKNLFSHIIRKFNELFLRLLEAYDQAIAKALDRPKFTVAVIVAGILVVLVGLFPFLSTSYFPRTDPGQFVINIRNAAGSHRPVYRTRGRHHPPDGVEEGFGHDRF